MAVSTRHIEPLLPTAVTESVSAGGATASGNAPSPAQANVDTGRRNLATATDVEPTFDLVSFVRWGAAGVIAGTSLRYSKQGGTVNIGLTDGTVYYAAPTGNADLIQLFDTQAHAIAGGVTGLMQVAPAGAETHALVMVVNETVAGGNAPTATTSTVQGGGTALGNPPSPAQVPVAQGGALAGGTAPTESIGGAPVSETPTPGGALASGNAPTVRVPAPQGGALAGGNAPTARTSVTQGGATAGGNAPTARTSVTAGGGLAGGNAATVRVISVAGGCSGGGNPPNAYIGAIIGGGTALGVGGVINVPLGQGGGTAGGVPPNDGIAAPPNDGVGMPVLLLLLDDDD